MDAREYHDLLRDDNAFIRLSHWNEDGQCDGRCQAVILDVDHQIAITLQPCGDPNETKIDTGAIVKFILHPEAEPKIVGAPAYAVPKVLGGLRI